MLDLDSLFSTDPPASHRLVQSLVPIQYLSIELAATTFVALTFS